jgi:hypothetical protein
MDPVDRNSFQPAIIVGCDYLLKQLQTLQVEAVSLMNMLVLEDHPVEV